MNEIISAILMVIGAFFSLMASIGTLRFPDIYMRMGAATKAGTLGAGFQLCAVAAYFWKIEIVSEAVAAIGFFILTAPVGAHMIGRAAYAIGVKKWPGMVRDDLKERYVPRDDGA